MELLSAVKHTQSCRMVHCCELKTLRCAVIEVNTELCVIRYKSDVRFRKICAVNVELAKKKGKSLPGKKEKRNKQKRKKIRNVPGKKQLGKLFECID